LDLYQLQNGDIPRTEFGTPHILGQTTEERLAGQSLGWVISSFASANIIKTGKRNLGEAILEAPL
jgi:hypothetical protein